MYSERLTYRLLNINDLAQVHELHSVPSVDKFNTLGIPKDLEETKEILENWICDHEKTKASKTFAIRNESNKFIGVFGIKFSNKKYNKAEIWFKLNPDYWNSGYATESVRYFLKLCFEKYQLHRIEAGCAVKNLASKRVLEKCGFQVEGIQRKNLPLSSGWSDNYEFGILQEEWFK